MLTKYIAELLESQDEVTALDVAIYTGCEMRRAHRALSEMDGLVRVEWGVYAIAPGATLRVASKTDELLSCLPSTIPELAAEMFCSRKSVYNTIQRLRKSGIAIVRGEKGVYDVV